MFGLDRNYVTSIDEATDASQFVQRLAHQGDWVLALHYHDLGEVRIRWEGEVVLDCKSLMLLRPTTACA